MGTIICKTIIVNGGCFSQLPGYPFPVNYLIIGGGGGGSRSPGVDNMSSGPGGSGGSGIAIFRYQGPQRAIGGNTYSCCGNTIHLFANSGNIAFCSTYQ